MATEEFAGPVDFLVFTFSRDADLGAGLSDVLERVRQGTIGILDIEIITRDVEGTPLKLAFEDLQGATTLNLSVFDGVESGILDDEDLADIASALDRDQIAVALVYEDRCLAAAADSWAKVGGGELFSGGVDITDLEHALEERNPS